MTAPRPAVLLHIGAMKTGTTFVQKRMVANADALREAGVLLPVGGSWLHQVRAVQDVLRLDRRDPRVRREAAGAWPALVRELLAHPGRSVLSMEFLSFAGPRQAEAIVRSFDGADLDVVLSVRDAQAVVPGQWQTSVHNRSRVSWPDYLAAVRASLGWRGRVGRRFPDPALRSFLRACDVPRMIATWSRVVPPERLHVLTVPRPGAAPDLLWRRFAGVLGVDPASFPEPAPRDNASLGFASTELVRRVNRALGSVRLTDYNGTVKRGLALEILAPRAEHEGRAQLDPATREVAVAWNARSRAAVTASGARVVGDLADLPDAPDQASVPYRSAPREAEVLDAAEVGLAEMTRLVRRYARRRRRAGDDVPLPVEVPGARQRWASAADPVDAAATELAELCRTAIEHRRRLFAWRSEPVDEASEQDAG